VREEEVVVLLKQEFAPLPCCKRRARRRYFINMAMGWPPLAIVLYPYMIVVYREFKSLAFNKEQ
jgi:hypothetical protein